MKRYLAHSIAWQRKHREAAISTLNSPLLARLRAETHGLHARVETRIPALNRSWNATEYRRYLTMLWGFHQPMESRLQAFSSSYAQLPDLSQRRKIHLLAADLRTLGASVEALPVAEHCVEIVDFESALGCLYVVEGSMLGNRLIHTQLHRHGADFADESTRFLLGYDDGGRLWRAFLAHLNDVESRVEHDRVLAAAKDAFGMADVWFQRCALPSAATATSQPKNVEEEGAQ